MNVSSTRLGFHARHGSPIRYFLYRRPKDICIFIIFLDTINIYFIFIHFIADTSSRASIWAGITFLICLIVSFFRCQARDWNYIASYRKYRRHYHDYTMPSTFWPRFLIFHFVRGMAGIAKWASIIRYRRDFSIKRLSSIFIGDISR